MKHPLPSRRNFLAASATATFGFQFFRGHLFGAAAPSNQLNLAAIGVGAKGQGVANLKACAGENIVALCDVDSQYAAPTFARYPAAKTYVDYREMLEKQKDIDAVIIATPDHTHAVITLAALAAGKHVYCQKPLTHTIREARTITEAARRAKVQTQMGNQGHSSESIRLLKEWLAAGVIGDVREVHAWTDRPVGGDPWSNFAVQAQSKETPPVPATLDWDLWLGPVAHRPYHPDYHPLKWRAWLDFGTGPLGDMGCHIIDPAFWALDLGAPISVEATTTHWEKEVSSQTFPRASIVRYQFPARGARPPVALTWYDGRLQPPIPADLEPGRKLPGSGALIIGDKGTLLHGSHGAGGLRLLPETRMKELVRPEKTLPRVTGSHEADWLRACKAGPGAPPPCSTFEYGGALTETVLLGVLAMRLPNQRLAWDSAKLQFVNNSAADDLLHTPYRNGWSL
ncbi:MAG: Inositol 2-dehydrogenase [Verrucomicrobiota bacterium]|jgi:predicted dehydrogenase